jgi:hypothetical protein
MNSCFKVSKYCILTFCTALLIIFISSYPINFKLSSNNSISDILFFKSLQTAFGDQIDDQIEFSKQQAIEKFKNQFCGINSTPNSNKYIHEIKSSIIRNNQNILWIFYFPAFSIFF